MAARHDRLGEERRVSRGLFAAGALYSEGLAFACRSFDEEAIGLGLRLQARLSFALFVLALAAPGLQARTGWSVLAGPVRHRDTLFRGFAASHLVHGAWILAYFARTPAVFVWNVVDVSGALAFPLIALLLLPLDSLFGARARLVRRGVVVYAWLQFVGFFIDRLEAGRPELRAWYVAAIVICVMAAAIAFTAERFPSRQGATS
jgi:hypothetical protein